MRVLGAIMFIVGVLATVTMFLPVLIFIFIENDDMATKVAAAIILLIFLGTPCFLLIFFGVRLFRRKKPAVEAPRPYVPEPPTAARPARPAPAPVPPSDSYSSYEHSNNAPDQVDEWLDTLNRRAKELNQQRKASSRSTSETSETSAAPSPPPEPKTAVCKNCGASKNVAGGEKAICDYCGTVLS
ncbi:hypothetical protein B1748_00880 [Paenibacillus sp. MY03]|nr:hypothetical protein B1748_00880 [Paenibacillus sp. MY03]